MTYFNEFGQARLGWRTSAGGGGSTIDADAQAFITAALITDTTQQSAINTLVTQLKTYGIWTKMKAIYPFVGGTATTHKWNLKDPRDLDAAYRLVFTGGGVHSSTGYQLNGSNSWADTKLIPSNILSAGNCSLGFYSRTNRSGTLKTVMGTITNVTYSFLIYPRYTDNKAYFGLADDSNGNKPSVTSTLGFYQGARNNSTTQSLSNINGNNYSYNYNTTSLPNTSVFIGTINFNPTSYVDTLELAFSYIGENLSATDLSNYYTAVQTFQTTLGRQVGVPIVADSDAQAFLNAAVITDQTQANAVNTLVTSLKSANIWTKMKAIYPFVGGTATTHKFNLKDPRDLDAAFRLQFNGGITHNSNGVTMNGTNGGAYTYFNPFLNATNGSLHLSVYSRNRPSRIVSDNDFNPMAGYTLSGWVALRVTSNAINNQEFFSTSDTAQGAVGAVSTSVGYGIGSQTATNSRKYYKNGVLLNTNTTNDTTAYINANLSLNGSPFATYSASNYAFATLGDGLTDAEAAAFYNAVQAYQTALNRQV